MEMAARSMEMVVIVKSVFESFSLIVRCS